MKANESRASGPSALERFEWQTALPMLVLAVAIIPLLLIPSLTEVSGATKTTFVSMEWFIWAAFALEYAIRLTLAPATWAFFRHNKIDLLVVLLPFLEAIANSAVGSRSAAPARCTSPCVRGAGDDGPSLGAGPSLPRSRPPGRLNACHWSCLPVETLGHDAPKGNITGVGYAL